MGILDNGFNVDIGKYMPDTSGLGSSLLTVLFWVIVLASLGVFAYFFWDNRRYKYKIEIYENTGGTRYVQSGTDRARVQKIGDQGEEILVLKKRKKIVTSYNRKMGNNLIWFAVGQDGYWYNVTLGDLDSKQGMLDIEPIDRDMRYAHTAIRKNYNERYNKQKFMDKYGSMIIVAIFLLIVVIAIGFYVNKLSETAETFTQASKDFREVAEINKGVLSSLDNIYSTSGIKRAT